MAKSKCRLCSQILTGIRDEIITCDCGEITLDGKRGVVLCKSATRNYVEIDENECEIVVDDIDREKMKRDKLIDMLDEMRKSYEGLPKDAMLQPINHYDMSSLLILLVALVRADK